jgi:WS/DGAT/MGAT family acyltransferase
MPTLSVLDAAMFAFENKRRPFAVGPLVVLKPEGRQARGFADRLVTRMLERPVKAPFDYTLRLGVGLPSVESVQGVDPSAHVQRITLRGEATMEELFALVGELQVKLLDRSRPLWELYVIDGLEHGRVALYGKVHHGIVDGRGLVNMLEHWLSRDPADPSVRAMWEGIPRSSPSAERAWLAERLLDVWDRAGALVDGTRGLVRLLARRGATTLRLARGLPFPFVSVPNVLDGRLSDRRSYAHCVLSLVDLKAFGKAHRATINDVFLTLLDLALERYLRERGTQLRRPLVVDMPVALASAGGGNQIAVMQFPLGQPGAGPAQRLRAVCEHTVRLKQETARQSADSAMLYTALAHAYPSLIERIGLGRPVKLANMVVSNPFGMPRPCYLMGAEVELVLPISLVAPGQTLNITSVTLADRFQIGFLAVPEAVPDVEKLAVYTVEAFAQLQQAVAPLHPIATKVADEPAVARPGRRASASRKVARGRADHTPAQSARGGKSPSARRPR